VELLSRHYDCAGRNGIRVHRVDINRGAVAVADTVHWPLGLDGDTDMVQEGWLQCASAGPSLFNTGLQLWDNGTLTGRVVFNPEHAVGDYAVHLFAFNTKHWDSAGIMWLNLSFTVENRAVEGAQSHQRRQRQRDRNSAIARGFADAAFQIYAQWERRQIAHETAVEGMARHLEELRTFLNSDPAHADAWVWLGGLHMNVHKLLSNVLLHCELFLGQALLFSGGGAGGPWPEIAVMAEENLKGTCMLMCACVSTILTHTLKYKYTHVIHICMHV